VLEVKNDRTRLFLELSSAFEPNWKRNGIKKLKIAEDFLEELHQYPPPVVTGLATTTTTCIQLVERLCIAEILAGALSLSNGIEE
jgi:hypothetical protein